MPVVRGLGVVAKTEGKKQIEAVRAELRTQAFWTRRKRRSLSHARSSGGEGSVFSSRSGSEDDAEVRETLATPPEALTPVSPTRTHFILPQDTCMAGELGAASAESGVLG